MDSTQHPLLVAENNRKINNYSRGRELSIMWQIWLWKITGHLIVHIPKRRAVVEE